MSHRHDELLAMAAQREQSAEQARTARDNSPRGSYERGVYDQLAEDAKADARNLRVQVADERWRASR